MPKIEFTSRPAAGDRLLTEIPVERIHPNPSQPRLTFDEESIRELADSIAQVGLIQPLVVRRDPADRDAYILIAGERRLRACKLLGKPSAICIVQDMLEEASAMVALIENLQREDLDYMEEAQCYETLLSTYNLTQEELAKRLGRSQSAIANKLRLLRLTAPVKEALKNTELTERHTRALLKLDPQRQLMMIDQIRERGLSVKQTERQVEKLLDKIYDEKEAGAKPRPMIVRMVKDYRLFMNTINMAVNQLREAGFEVTLTQSDLDNGVDIGIQVRR